jgi:hypothetical protein
MLICQQRSVTFLVKYLNQSKDDILFASGGNVVLPGSGPSTVDMTVMRVVDRLPIILPTTTR